MSKTFVLLALALLAVCGIWLWVSVRKYAARRQREDERAVAFMAEAVKAAKQRGAGTGQKSA